MIRKLSLFFLVLLSVLVVARLVSVKDRNSGDRGRVLNVFVWNDEFESRMNEICSGRIPKNVRVNFIKAAKTSGSYIDRLDECLRRQGTVSDDEKIDLFLIQHEHLKKYINSPYLASLRDLGISEAELKDQYDFIMNMSKDEDGGVKAVSWQICPSGFYYRRSIAREVFGTDSPDFISLQLESYGAMEETAKKLLSSGYCFSSGFESMYYSFLSARTVPWVVDGRVTVDSCIDDWISCTKDFIDKGYLKPVSVWSRENSESMRMDAAVFGHFGPGWLMDFSLIPSSVEDFSKPLEKGNGSWGDWGFCRGPVDYSWGGSWICCSKDSDNKGLASDIMRAFACEYDSMRDIAVKHGDFVNNRIVMEHLAASDYRNDFLGGENPFAVMMESVGSLRGDTTCIPSEDFFTGAIWDAMEPYFSGESTLDASWKRFHDTVGKSDSIWAHNGR